MRTTRSADGSDTSTSVIVDDPGDATFEPATDAAATDAVAPGSGTTHPPPREMTSSRRPWRSSSLLHPASSFSESRSRGRGATSTLRRVPPEATKSVTPSVFTRSGSSTPSSCTFVVE